MSQNIYKACLFLLVVSLSTYSIELSFLVAFLVMGLSFSAKLNNALIIIVCLLFFLNLTGLISSYSLDYPLYDTLKDAIYYIRPLIILLASYFVIKRIKSKETVFKIVILIGLFYAVKHLTAIVMNIGNIDSYVYLRSLGGKQNHIEMVSLVFLLFSPYKKIFKRYRSLIIFLISISFVLYLSRVMFIMLFIFFLGYKGYLFLNVRIVKSLVVLASISLLLGVVLSSVETNRDSTGIELFEPFDKDLILQDRRSLWEHWRAYEAQMAIEMLQENGIKAWVMGMGYGPPIELGTWVKLDGKRYTAVPSIHNGFIFVLFKTGIIGLMFYTLFLFFVFFNYQELIYRKNPNVYNKLLVATSVYMILNSFVITGIFRPGEYSVFLLGVFIALRSKSFNAYSGLNESKKNLSPDNG